MSDSLCKLKKSDDDGLRPALRICGMCNGAMDIGSTAIVMTCDWLAHGPPFAVTQYVEIGLPSTSTIMSTGTQIQGELRPRDIVKSDDPLTWDLSWCEHQWRSVAKRVSDIHNRTQGVTPWDAGAVQPSLVEVVEKSGLDLPEAGRALVPGCGTVS